MKNSLTSFFFFFSSNNFVNRNNKWHIIFVFECKYFIQRNNDQKMYKINRTIKRKICIYVATCFFFSFVTNDLCIFLVGDRRINKPTVSQLKWIYWQKINVYRERRGVFVCCCRCCCCCAYYKINVCEKALLSWHRCHCFFELRPQFLQNHFFFLSLFVFIRFVFHYFIIKL